MKWQEHQGEGSGSEVQVGRPSAEGSFPCSRLFQSTEVFLPCSGSSAAEVPRWSLACEKVFAAESTGCSCRGDAKKTVAEEEEVGSSCFQAPRAGPFAACFVP